MAGGAMNFDGIGKIFGAGGGAGYQQSFDNQAALLAKMGLAQSGIRENDASVALKGTQAQEIAANMAAAAKARAIRDDPEALARNVMFRMPEAQPDAVMSLAKRAAGGPFAVDPRLTPDQLRLAGETMGGLNAFGFADKVGGEDVASLYKNSANTAMSQRAPEVAKTDPTQAAWMLGAASGKGAPTLAEALPGGIGTYSPLTGAENHNGMFDSKLNLDKAHITQARAAAGASGAAAQNSLAHAGLARAQTGEVGNNSKEVIYTDQGVFVRDKKTDAIKPLVNGETPLTKTTSATAEPKLKDVPQQVNKQIAENTAQISVIDRALKAVKENPNALGVKNYMPNAFNQWRDPGGVDARAGVSDVGSLKMHDRSGASVTISESPRLMPFIPLATDSAEIATKKLNRLREELREETRLLGSAYTDGFRPNSMIQGSQAADSPAGAPGVPTFDQSAIAAELARRAGGK